MIVSASSASSCAHVELAARTVSTPRESFIGRARAAIRDPTAASQSRNATGLASTEAGIRTVVLPRSTCPSGVSALLAGLRLIARGGSRRLVREGVASADLGHQVLVERAIEIVDGLPSPIGAGPRVIDVARP